MSELVVWSRISSLVVFAVGLHLVNVLNLWYRRKKQVDGVHREVESVQSEVSDCCFVSGEASKDCEMHLFKKKPCYRDSCTFKNLRRLLESLNSCRRTLDICINLMSSVEVAESIVEAALQRKIRVRIITDAIMARNIGSQIPMLAKAGIEVRYPSDVFMHSKFAVMDTALLVIGSMNWTVQGLHGNWDAFVCTSQPDLVKDYTDIFNRMWEKPNLVRFT